jgi:hypothetical protein
LWSQSPVKLENIFSLFRPDCPNQIAVAGRI